MTGALGCIIRQLEESGSPDPSKYGDGKGGPFDFSRQAGLLSIALSAAVPLWYAELRELEKTLEGNDALFAAELMDRAKRCSDYLGKHGDALMFRVKGQSAEAFNRLAEGIAIMAFCPGGVTAFGSHWEEKRTVQRYADPPTGK